MATGGRGREQAQGVSNRVEQDRLQNIEFIRVGIHSLTSATDGETEAQK